MPKTISIPDVGDIDFPDSMSDADIAKTARNLHGQTQFDKTKAAFEAQPRMGIMDQAKALGKLAASPVTSLFDLPRQIGEAFKDPGAAARANLNPETASNLYGSAGHDPLGEAVGNASAAIPAAMAEAGVAAKGAAANRAAIMERLGVPTEQAPATGGPIPSIARTIAEKIARKHPSVKMGMIAVDIASALKEHLFPEQAPAQEPITGNPRPFAPPPAPRLIGNYAPEATAPAGPMAETAPSAAQIPANASPAQLAPFSPQTVLDYLQERAKPVLATSEAPAAAEASAPVMAKEVAKRPARAAKVITIPSPEPEFPAETYAASARATKAGKLAQLLHEHAIPYEDAKLMGDAEWAQAAQAAGVKIPSADSVKLTLFELKKLGRRGRLSEMNPKAAQIASDLDKEMNK